MLSTIRWAPAVRERFLEAGARELPAVRCRRFDSVAALAPLDGFSIPAGQPRVVRQWLKRTEGTLRRTAAMLGASGTASFSRHSQAIYGRPGDALPGTARTVLDQAQRIIKTAERVASRLPEPPPPSLRPGDVAMQIRAAVGAHFGKSAPRVKIVAGLSARASASPGEVRLRRDARFSDLDIQQLIQHEAFVHVATSLNGRRQRAIPVLAANHAGTTRTQEGLAVLAELLSGSLDLRRLLRLAHRVEAIHMALEGADFLEVYHYFCNHSPTEGEAYQSTVRVFRGCPVGGGSAFTKDMVYLDGLCRVHVFVRTAVQTGRIDCLRLLFAGKLDLIDLPALATLRAGGQCKPPQFVAPWVDDPHRVVAYFAATDVIGRAATAGLRSHYEGQLSAIPETDES